LARYPALFWGHPHNKDLIKHDIGINGGYVLHFDGSTEQQCGQSSLVLIDSRSDHVLESSMVDSESCDTIKKSLHRILVRFGHPLAIVSDLKPGFVKTCIEVFGKKVKHILCHYHFLRTFRDKFTVDHQFLKTSMTKKWQLQAGLSKQCKSLQDLEVIKERELKTIEMIEDYWVATGDVLGSYRVTMRWILNYRQDSAGKGLPFDLPFLDLFQRLLAGKILIDKIFSNASSELRLKFYLHGFCRILEKTSHLGAKEKGFRKAVRNLEYFRKWFYKLRAVLFLESRLEADKPLAPLSKQYHLTPDEAKRIPLRLSEFLASVERESKRCKHLDRKAFLEEVGKQIRKYRKNIHVPLLSATVDGKELFFVPPRTNNCLEAIFRYVKTLLRRCTGRGKLPKEFGSVGALLPYYLLMRDHPTFKNFFDDDSRLAEEFAKLFLNRRPPLESLDALPEKSGKMAESEDLINDQA
jgi:hypothetical protein